MRRTTTEIDVTTGNRQHGLMPEEAVDLDALVAAWWNSGVRSPGEIWQREYWAPSIDAVVESLDRLGLDWRDR